MVIHLINDTNNLKIMNHNEHTKLHWDQGDIRNGKTKLKMEVT